MTDPQQPSPADRPDADAVEQHACPKCGAQPGSPCRSRGGAVASAYHTRPFTQVPRLKKVLRVPTPADRGPGRPWRPGTPPPAPIDPGLPSADIRIGYARCSTLGQELDSQLDALSKHGIPRDKIFSEKISTRVRVRPRFEEALRTAREVEAHAPHCRVIFTVYEMKRLGRDAAELTALADHLTARGLVLEMLAGPRPGIYDPTGPGKLLFAFFAAMAETERGAPTTRPSASNWTAMPHSTTGTIRSCRPGSRWSSRRTSDDVLAGIKALTVKQVTSAWWEGFGYARDYFETHGDLSVPSGHVTENGFRLGQWVLNARQHRRKGWLRPERVAALDGIGMVWNTTDLPWNRFLQELRIYRKEFGHLRVPQAYVSPTGYALGSKINTTRSQPTRAPAAVRAALDELGMIWDTRDLAWQEFFTACQEYAQEHGDLNGVTAGWKTKTGYTLGTRLKRYRSKWQQGTIDPAELTSLADLGWKPELGGKAGSWVRFLAAADRYVAQRGSLRTVRKDYVGEEGYPLGRNVMYYRNLKNGTKTKQTKNRALSAARAPVERGMARLKSWQIFRRSRISPNRMSVISRAVLTLERQC